MIESLVIIGVIIMLIIYGVLVCILIKNYITLNKQNKKIIELLSDKKKNDNIS